MSSVVVLSVFGQEGNIFSICCSTGESLLDFIKVTIKANQYRECTGWSTYQNSAYDVALAERHGWRLSVEE